MGKVDSLIRGLDKFRFIVLGAAILSGTLLSKAALVATVTEAPAGFDNQTNGAITPAEFERFKGIFTEVEDAADGLGPVFNNTSCVGCHFSGGAIGGSSQVTVLRAGHYETSNGHWMRFRRDQNEYQRRYLPGGSFVPATIQLADGSVIEERSLVNQRAICADAQSMVTPTDNITSQRISLSVLGDGFVGAVADDTFRALSASQSKNSKGRIRGQVIDVPVLEAAGLTAVGRFGAKAQHASLMSFAADAYLNEMGVTSPLLPDEVTTVCQPAGVSNPNSSMDDIFAFAAFMRATKTPPRGAITPQVNAGLAVFRALECSTCHVESLQTAPPGTRLFGGEYIVPEALGNKTFHPFGDYLLHDVGTGDSIVQNGGEDTANKLRTIPLWGLRTRTELMHDGASTNFDHAIQRHRGEALYSSQRYSTLSLQQKQDLWAFLRSL